MGARRKENAPRLVNKKTEYIKHLQIQNMKHLSCISQIVLYLILSAPINAWKARSPLHFQKGNGQSFYFPNHGFPKSIQALIKHSGGNILLMLQKNTHLFSRNYSERVTTSTEVIERQIDPVRLTCYYHGTVDGDESSKVAVSLCKGMSGSFTMNRTWFQLKPEKNPLIMWSFVNLVREDNPEEYTCGFERSFEKNIEREMRQRRDTRQFDRDVRIVEIYLVVDKTLFVSLRNNEDLATARVREIINMAGRMYQVLDIYLTIIGINILREIGVNQIADPHNFLMAWKDYRISKLGGWPKHDLGVLAVKMDFGRTVGMALENVMCKLSNSVAFIVDVESIVVSSATLAHEIGHTFGILHDEDYGSCKCPASTCLMEAVVQNTKDSSWSDCSITILVGLYESGSDVCLFNEVNLLMDRVCGNGLHEDSEDCDCGNLPSQICSKKCCDSATCKLTKKAVCSHGMCCDLKKCQYMSSRTTCRPSAGECDVEEKCTGTSHMCPTDRWIPNGSMCTGSNYCYLGKCVNKDVACSELFGGNVKESEASCYSDNVKGDEKHNCGYSERDPTKFIKCDPEHVMCGTLMCNASLEQVNAIFKKYKLKFAQGHLHMMCAAVYFDVFMGVPDLGYAPDGSKCGENKICFQRRCIDRGVFMRETNARVEPVSRGDSKLPSRAFNLLMATFLFPCLNE